MGLASYDTLLVCCHDQPNLILALDLPSISEKASPPHPGLFLMGGASSKKSESRLHDKAKKWENRSQKDKLSDFFHRRE